MNIRCDPLPAIFSPSLHQSSLSTSGSFVIKLFYCLCELLSLVFVQMLLTLKPPHQVVFESGVVQDAEKYNKGLNYLLVAMGFWAKNA